MNSIQPIVSFFNKITELVDCYVPGPFKRFLVSPISCDYLHYILTISACIHTSVYDAPRQFSWCMWKRSTLLVVISVFESQFIQILIVLSYIVLNYIYIISTPIH